MGTAVREYTKINYIDERRYEIIGGRKYMALSASFEHNSMVFRLYDVFRDILGKENFRFSFDMDTVFGKANVPRPDFVIISDFSKIADGKNIKGAPDFIAEVLSPSNSAHDLITKRDLYEKHGVPEYWIVDINNKNIHVYVLKDGSYGNPSIYHYFTPEEVEEIEQGYDDADKEQIKITHISSRTFGDEIHVPINKIFENII